MVAPAASASQSTVVLNWLTSPSANAIACASSIQKLFDCGSWPWARKPTLNTGGWLATAPWPRSTGAKPSPATLASPAARRTVHESSVGSVEDGMRTTNERAVASTVSAPGSAVLLPARSSSHAPRDDTNRAWSMPAAFRLGMPGHAAAPTPGTESMANEAIGTSTLASVFQSTRQ